jgi:hypothetical protein
LFPIDKLDTLDNLILLCRVHHKVIDDQPATYTVASLQRMKVAHEQWVAETLGQPAPARGRYWSVGSIAALLVLVGIAWLPEVLRVPVALTYVGQAESRAGYVLHLRINSTNGRTVYLPVENFRVTVMLDEQVLTRMATADRAHLVSGENVTVFTSGAVLETAIAGRSYANVDAQVACVPQARDLFLLVTVQGPNSTNPSARFQLGVVYRGLKVTVRSGLWSRQYLDVPITHVPLLAGDDNTRIIQR